MPPGAGIEVAGDHDPDRLDPAWDVEHLAEPAFDEDVLLAGCGLPPGPRPRRILNPEEFQALVILVETARHGGEVGPPDPPAAGGTTFLACAFGSTAASAAPTPTGAIAGLSIAFGAFARRPAGRPRTGRLRGGLHAVSGRQRLVIGILPRLSAGRVVAGTWPVGGLRLSSRRGLSRSAVTSTTASPAAPATASPPPRSRLARLILTPRISLATGERPFVDDIDVVVLPVGRSPLRRIECGRPFVVAAIGHVASVSGLAAFRIPGAAVVATTIATNAFVPGSIIPATVVTGTFVTGMTVVTGMLVPLLGTDLGGVSLVAGRVVPTNPLSALVAPASTAAASAAAAATAAPPLVATTVTAGGLDDALAESLAARAITEVARLVASLTPSFRQGLRPSTGGVAGGGRGA